MQFETQSLQLPQYQSALLKKQRQSRVLSPKVTHIYPQIKQVQKLKIKKHHLDDTDVKQVLHYDYEQNQSPKQYLLRGNRLQYDKNDYANLRKGFIDSKSNTGFGQSNPNQLKLNSQYFQSQQNFAQHNKPQRDVGHQINTSKKNTQKYNQPQNTQNRLKKSISTSDFESLKYDQQQMQHKVLDKLDQLQSQNNRINNYLRESKQKSAHVQSVISRHKSETKSSLVQKEFNKLKDKLEKQRTKEKQRLENELNKIKEETNKLKQQQRQRNKSFKQLISKQHNYHSPTDNLILPGHRPPTTSMQTVTSTHMNHMTGIQNIENDNLIREKLYEIQKKYLPKTNIVNKRIQCDLYDQRLDSFRRISQKPRFVCNQRSQTDSQFSDY